MLFEQIVNHLQNRKIAMAQGGDAFCDPTVRRAKRHAIMQHFAFVL